MAEMRGCINSLMTHETKAGVRKSIEAHYMQHADAGLPDAAAAADVSWCQCVCVREREERGERTVIALGENSRQILSANNFKPANDWVRENKAVMIIFREKVNAKRCLAKKIGQNCPSAESSLKDDSASRFCINEDKNKGKMINYSYTSSSIPWKRSGSLKDIHGTNLHPFPRLICLVL